MNDYRLNKEKQTKFMQEHTLTEADVKKMIAEKFERARAYNTALRKREKLLEKIR